MENFLVDRKKTIQQTMHKIDRNGFGIAFILNDDETLFGIVTDGDIRRAILKGCSIEENIDTIANTNPFVISDKKRGDQIIQSIKEIGLFGAGRKLSHLKIPIVNNQNKMTDILFVLKEKHKIFYESICKNSEEVQAKRDNLKKILIIGGAGYLGSKLCRKLLEEGFKVRVLDSLLYGDDGIQDLYSNLNFELIRGDIRSIESVVNSISGVDAVIHLAALVGDPASSLNPQKTLEINFHSTKMIAEICKYHQVNRFIFASTCSVYGKNEFADTPLTELSDLEPVSLYAKTKIESENALLSSNDENFAPTIFRLATLFGLSYRMRFDLVVNLLAAKAFYEKRIPIFGGSQFRPILHIEDVCDAFIKCLKSPIEKIRREVFNIGSNDQNYRIIEIGTIINNFFPDANMDLNESTVDERNYYVDFTKAREILNFEPKRNVQYCLNELKREFEKGKFNDFMEKKFSNHKSLQSVEFQITEEVIMKQE